MADRRALSALVALLALVLLAAPLRAEPGGSDATAERLHRLHRSLHALHDRALVDPAAPALAAALGRTLDGALAAAPTAAWDDPRALAALVARALSGGDAAALHAALDDADNRLDGALANALRLHLDRSPRAAQALAAALQRVPNEARALAHLAIGALAADRGEGARHLALAALAAPGTLVEEAALRRRLAMPPGDGAEAREWARAALAHLHRFPRAPHRARAIELVARGLPPRASWLADGADGLIDAAPALAPALAREAVLAGETALAGIALDRSGDGPRVRAYRKAIDVRAPLPAPEAGRLSPADRAIEAARARVAASIAAPTIAPITGNGAPTGEADGAPVLPGLDAVLARARDALERSR